MRFVFGLPFAALMLAGLGLAGPLPVPGPATIGWCIAGALSQIAATALMLRAMEARGFAVITALIKTEPVSLALLGAAFLAEPLGPARLAAIGMTVTGVLLASGTDWRRAAPGPMLVGLAAGALFGVSALAFRVAILALPSGGPFTRATLALTLALALQAALFGLWFAGPGRGAGAAVRRDLRASVGAGFLGALASQFWFLAFALTPAANVRTLALIEVPLAAVVSRRLFAEASGPRQIAGMGLIVAGVAALLGAV